MARQKEFDRDNVLDKAMELFWRQGYEATSIQNLVDHLGIGRGSLYDTFGGKRALFKAALARYQSQAGRQAFLPLSQPGPVKAAIEQVFDNLIAEAVTDSNRCGCFMVNSAVELAPGDPAMAGQAKAAVEGMTALFYQALVRGRASGEIPAERDLQALARFLNNAVLGLRVMAKIDPRPEVLQDIAAATLAGLD